MGPTAQVIHYHAGLAKIAYNTISLTNLIIIHFEYYFLGMSSL